MYIHIYQCICTYTYMYMYIHSFVYMHRNVCICAYQCLYMYIHWRCCKAEWQIGQIFTLHMGDCFLGGSKVIRLLWFESKLLIFWQKITLTTVIMNAISSDIIARYVVCYFYNCRSNLPAENGRRWKEETFDRLFTMTPPR
jgi:hypothetical protein